MLFESIIQIVQYGAYFVLALTASFVLWLLYRATKRTIFFFKRQKPIAFSVKNVKIQWQEVERLINEEGAMNHKMAILEADKLFDSVLKAMGIPGSSFLERIKFASYQYPKLREVWWAHKLRNELVHEVSYALNPGLAKKAVKEFRKALAELGAL